MLMLLQLRLLNHSVHTIVRIVRISLVFLLLLGSSLVELTLHEGRKHQVKRMCEAVGHPVQHLHRSRYAGLTLGGLEPGRWRELEPSEVKRLRNLPLEP